MDERTPTSHERAAGRPWDASYTEGKAPWDIGAPQPAVARLLASGAFVGSVLDAGCGTGENALLLADSGFDVVAVDIAETALGMARASAAERGLQVQFLAVDALHLERLERQFDTVLDSALFHAFEGAERDAYAAALQAVTRPGSRVYLICFSDEGTDLGPHPVGAAELRATFGGDGWRIDSIVAERLETNFHAHGAPAWLARLERVQGAS